MIQDIYGNKPYQNYFCLVCVSLTGSVSVYLCVAKQFFHVEKLQACISWTICLSIRPRYILWAFHIFSQFFARTFKHTTLYFKYVIRYCWFFQCIYQIMAGFDIESFSKNLIISRWSTFFALVLICDLLELACLSMKINTFSDCYEINPVKIRISYFYLNEF